MIDTGCPVTILATSVFERMCVADPRIPGRLRPCHRRLASADSSPLMVHGDLCMMVFFPGLQCDTTLVITSIWSEGLLGTEALQSCCLTSLIYTHVNCGPMDSPHCSCISNFRWSGRPRIPRARWWCHRIVKSWRQSRSGHRRVAAP